MKEPGKKLEDAWKPDPTGVNEEKIRAELDRKERNIFLISAVIGGKEKEKYFRTVYEACPDLGEFLAEICHDNGNNSPLEIKTKKFFEGHKDLDPDFQSQVKELYKDTRDQLKEIIQKVIGN